ncbi:hypothetical protein HELRODRAFT_189103 [Helobdella robusta]|uniref:Uncharacterized protein n=1 Tax=Helobdella robusta TaxID=6412 RepID=T1FQN5_HELRO|nr:hypothetical protein HELRODRAFT_189103 [Helobdella robusta]ESN96089.1 hypothetical protein HELRODRAFT_189103 [Helobdella robusta]
MELLSNKIEKFDLTKSTDLVPIFEDIASITERIDKKLTLEDEDSPNRDISVIHRGPIKGIPTDITSQDKITEPYKKFARPRTPEYASHGYDQVNNFMADRFLANVDLFNDNLLPPSLLSHQKFMAQSQNFILSNQAVQANLYLKQQQQQQYLSLIQPNYQQSYQIPGVQLQPQLHQTQQHQNQQPQLQQPQLQQQQQQYQTFDFEDTLNQTLINHSTPCLQPAVPVSYHRQQQQLLPPQQQLLQPQQPPFININSSYNFAPSDVPEVTDSNKNKSAREVLAEQPNNPKFSMPTCNFMPRKNVLYNEHGEIIGEMKVNNEQPQQQQQQLLHQPPQQILQPQHHQYQQQQQAFFFQQAIQQRPQQQQQLLQNELRYQEMSMQQPQKQQQQQQQQQQQNYINNFSKNLQKDITYSKNINYGNKTNKEYDKTLPENLKISKTTNSTEISERRNKRKNDEPQNENLEEKNQNEDTANDLRILDDYLGHEDIDDLISNYDHDIKHMPQFQQQHPAHCQSKNDPCDALSDSIFDDGDDIDDNIDKYGYVGAIRNLFQEMEKYDLPGEKFCFADEIIAMNEKIDKENLSSLGELDSNGHKSPAIIIPGSVGTDSPIGSNNGFQSDLKALGNVDIGEQDEEGDNLIHGAVINSDLRLMSKIVTKLKIDDGMKKVLEMKNKLKQTPLSIAVISNQSRFVKQLIDLGADPNTNIIPNCSDAIAVKSCLSMKPLHFAAAKGHLWLDCLKELLASPVIDVNAANSDGKTPLICAILNHGQFYESKKINSIQTIEVLVENGANMNKPDPSFDMTPLHYAISAKSYDLVRCIVGLADSHIPNSSKQLDRSKNELAKMMSAKTGAGYTALHLAVAIEMPPSEHFKLIQLLLSKGADPSCKNSDGQLPRELTKNQKVVELLKGLGTKHATNRKTPAQQQPYDSYKQHHPRHHHHHQQKNTIFSSSPHSMYYLTPPSSISGSVSSNSSGKSLSPMRHHINVPSPAESTYSTSPSSSTLSSAYQLRS